jgi:predicted CoA-substrate-specific enzyme activase
LNKAAVNPTQVDKVVATGQGKWDAHFAHSRVVEPVADAKAARWLSPSAKAVIDIGADQARAVQFDAGGKITQYTLNHKCAAGIGLFFESAAQMLGMSIDEMSKTAPSSLNSVKVNDQCAALAELDVVALIHNNTPKDRIVQVINEAMAAKLSAMLNEMLDPIQKEVVLVGGAAKNDGLMYAFKNRLGIKCIIPEEPQFAGALGAALIAAG